MPSPVLQFKRGNASSLNFGLRAGEPAVTLDTNDFYVGIDSTLANNKFYGSSRYWSKETTSKGSGVNLVEGTTNGSSYITLKSPDSLAGVVTFTLPSSDGTNGQVLKTDGSGNLSFVSVASTFSIAGDTGFDDFNSGGTLTFVGGTNVNTAVTDNTVTFNLDSGITLTNVNATGIVTAPTLAGVTTVDATTKATLEAVLGSEPNTFSSLLVTGISTLSGNVILGDNTSDDITVGGEFVSSLNPSNTNAYDLGTSTQRWRDLFLSGNLNVAGVITAVGYNDLTVANRDIVLAYIDGATETDTTANHGGIAVASTEGYPLVNLDVAGINTLPTTYKQIMWVKGGTMGAGTTDAWLLNYAVGVGSTQVPTGVVFAAGSVQVSSAGTVTANNFSGSLTGNASSADQVKTVTASDTQGTYHVTFVNSNNGSATNETVFTDDGIFYNPGANKLTTQNAEFTGNVLVSGITTLAGNVTITGIATATAFSGPLTGNVSGNLTGNVNSSGLSTFSSVNVANINSSLGVSALTITGASGAVTASNNLTVNGDLFVNGTTTQINTTELTVNDRTITLGIQTGATPTTTTWDLGVMMNYGDAGVAKTAGVIWDYSVERFVFSANSDNPASGSNTTTPVITVATHAPIEIASLWVNDCAGQSQVISCTGNERFLENITVDAGTF